MTEVFKHYVIRDPRYFICRPERCSTPTLFIGILFLYPEREELRPLDRQGSMTRSMTLPHPQLMRLTGNRRGHRCSSQLRQAYDRASAMRSFNFSVNNSPIKPEGQYCGRGLQSVALLTGC
jgi:hypothetical protein